MHSVPSYRWILGVREGKLGYGYIHIVIPVSLTHSTPFSTDNCSDIPIVIVAYGGWKLFKKTKILSLDDIPLQEALEEMREKPEERIPPARGWKRLNILWG
jgi:hypothetical protein